ncbi:methylglyoxal synthase [Desertivirga xinjiangensis]|uniref:methylglyoxal synthase n=1 Tax=Desertivirga xinjiangensis TaxID=539206 RepID=UPI0021096267|nr:methylglyoxal synthase [Pedobacter xinjiangensis]
MSTQTIALIAHDGRKPEMVAFVKEYYDILKNMKLIATGTTGSKIQETGLEVSRKLSGPQGGDAQIAAMAAEGDLKGIIFFRDPLGKHPHEPDVQMLLRVCDVHNVPLATNPASAKYLLLGMVEETESK